MSELKFTYEHPRYVSEAFAGGVGLQCVFAKEAFRRVVIETRLSDDLEWSPLRSVIVSLQKNFSIAAGAQGQKFRLRCDEKPLTVSYAKLQNTGSASGSAGSGSQAIEGLEDVTAEDVDDMTISTDDVHSIVNNAIAKAEGTSSDGSANGGSTTSPNP